MEIYIYNAYWNHILGYSRIMGYISNNNQRYEGIWACEPLEFGVPSNAQVVHVFFAGGTTDIRLINVNHT